MTITLSEFLHSIEFDYQINDDNTISLIDLLQANLGNIESEKYIIDDNLADFLVDRLDMYIFDYHLSGILETLQVDCGYSEKSIDLIPTMEKYPDEFPATFIQYISDIVNGNIDISELNNNKKEK